MKRCNRRSRKCSTNSSCNWKLLLRFTCLGPRQAVFSPGRTLLGPRSLLAQVWLNPATLLKVGLVESTFCYVTQVLEKSQYFLKLRLPHKNTMNPSLPVSTLRCKLSQLRGKSTSQVPSFHTATYQRRLSLQGSAFFFTAIWMLFSNPIYSHVGKYFHVPYFIVVPHFPIQTTGRNMNYAEIDLRSRI